MHPNIKFVLYANGTQLFINLTRLSAVQAFERLKLCSEDVRLCLGSNKLKLNLEKMAVIIFGYRIQRGWLEKFLPVNIPSCRLKM